MGKTQKKVSSKIKKVLHDYKKSGKIGTSRPKSMARAKAQAAAIAYKEARKKK